MNKFIPLKNITILVALQACVISHSAFALQNDGLTPPQLMMTVVNHSSCDLQPGQYVSNMWKETFKSGQSYVKSKEDWESDSDPFNQWLAPNHVMSDWNKNGPTGDCTGSAKASGTDPFTVDSMKNNAYGTYTIDKNDSVSWDSSKSSMDGGDDFRLFNGCLVYQHSIHNGATKDANSEFNIGFKNVCSYPVPLRDFYIAPADDNSKNLLDKSINLYLPSWTASAGKKTMDPSNPGPGNPVLGGAAFTNNEVEAYHVAYTDSWNKDGKTVVQPGASFSIGSYAQGYDWLNEIKSENGGNFYVYNKVISSAVATPNNTVQFYPSSTYLNQVAQGQQTYTTISTGDNFMSAPAIIGATESQPERVSFQSSLGDDVKVTDLSIHMQAIKLNDKAPDGNDNYLWQGANAKQEVKSSSVQKINLTKQEASGQITVSYSIVNQSSKSLPADLPSSTIDVSNADNQSSEKNITLASSEGSQSIGDLLPETATVSFQAAYYNDAINGVFWNFVPEKNSMDVDLSQTSSAKISNTYNASTIVSQQYTVNVSGVTSHIKKLDNLYLYFSDLTNSDIPAVPVKLTDIQTNNNKVNLRSGDNYSAILIQVKGDSSQNGIDSEKKTFTDPDNDKVLLDASNNLWRSSVTISGNAVTASVGSYQPEFAPYKDMGESPSLPDDSTNYPAKDAVTLAFVTSAKSFGSSCQYQLAGYTFDKPVDGTTTSPTLSQQLKNYKHDYYISFGGANGTMLSAVCKPKDLLNTYNEIYNQVKGPHFKGFDFDIEGGAQSDPNLLTNLPTVLKAFHRQHPEAEVWFTLPVMPYGLTDLGLTVVQDVANKQTGLTGVSIMAMDYGSASGDKKSMGDLAIDAATNLHAQLSNLYKGENTDKLYTMIVDTPMTGKNDTDEVFSTAEANKLLDWAKNTRGDKIGGIRFWSINRDEAPTSVGSSDAPYAFTKILSQIVDGGPTPPPPGPGTTPTVTGVLTQDVTGAGSMIKINKYYDGIITFTLKNGEEDKNYVVQEDDKQTLSLPFTEVNPVQYPCKLTSTNPTCKMDVAYVDDKNPGSYPSQGDSADVKFDLYLDKTSTSLDSTNVTVKADPTSAGKSIDKINDVSVDADGSKTFTITERGYDSSASPCDALSATGQESGVTFTGLDGGSAPASGVCTYNATVSANDAEAATKAITVTDSKDSSVTAPFNLTVTRQDPGASDIVINFTGNHGDKYEIDDSVEKASGGSFEVPKGGAEIFTVTWSSQASVQHEGKNYKLDTLSGARNGGVMVFTDGEDPLTATFTQVK